MKRCLILVAAATLALATAAFAYEGENLLVALPDGYKIDFQKRQGNMQITEMVPKAESVNGWTEMLTIQVFHNLKSTPEAFRDRINGLWAKSCPAAVSAPIVSAVESGYPMTMWLSSCPLNASTGKPEFTFMKAIQGKDSFYVVQKAFKFSPSKEQTTEWTQFLRKVAVCDTRLPDRACPAGIK